jgi:hypothetical protein
MSYQAAGGEQVPGVGDALVAPGEDQFLHLQPGGRAAHPQQLADALARAQYRRHHARACVGDRDAVVDQHVEHHLAAAQRHLERIDVERDVRMDDVEHDGDR